MYRRFATIILFLGLAFGCSRTTEAPDAPADDQPSATAEVEKLADGTYPCEAMNDSTGNGPYSLECTVDGESLTIHFANGGYIDDGTIDVEGPGPYEGEATDSRGNSWSVTIDQ